MKSLTFSVFTICEELQTRELAEAKLLNAPLSDRGNLRIKWKLFQGVEESTGESLAVLLHLFEQLVQYVTPFLRHFQIEVTWHTGR